MTVWLYQMNVDRVLEYGDKYKLEDFRRYVRDGKYLRWKTRNIISETEEPKAGDTIIYWFVKSGTDEPGLYGLGIIFKCYEKDDDPPYNKWILHLPVFPSERLKNHPIYDTEIEKIVNEIRGNKQAFGTMFIIKDNQAERLFKSIKEAEPN